ncbi:alpha/beta fold hydrolase [Hyphobacterium sp.]|uniref:alpha/beta fold hydrolase n=1 Tax=Hyphobacterium sp. TaxID=2004662 RepID=UPI003BA9E514
MAGRRMGCGFFLAVAISVSAYPQGFGVGFQRIDTYDLTREYGSASSDEIVYRPMQIGIWYPSNESSGTRMTLRNYIRAAATADTLAVGAAANAQQYVAEMVLALDPNILPESLAHRLSQATDAIENADPAPGTFPVIVIAAGSGAGWHDNFGLAERLASDGYVVLASRSAARTDPLMSWDQEGAETGARDLEFLAAHAAGLDFADISRLAVIGRSWGSVPAVLFAARNPNVDAIVSLDGTISYNAQTLDENRVLGEFDAASNLADPIFLAVGERRPENATAIDRVSYFENIRRADAYLASYRTLQHAAFSSLFLSLYFDPFDPASETLSPSDARTAFQLVMSDVSHFLDHYLSAGTNVPPSFEHSELRSIEYRPAGSPFPGPWAFSTVARIESAQAAIRLFETVRDENPPASDDMFGWRSLVNLINYFNQTARFDDALDIARFAQSRYPDRDVFPPLMAETYLLTGDWEAAEHRLNVILQDDPDNDRAATLLERLEYLSALNGQE